MFAQLLADRIVRFPLDTHIDVFRVLAVDDHIEVLGPFVRAGRPFVVAARTHAGIEVKDLPQGDVQRPDSTSDWGGQRALDGDAVLTHGFQGVFGQVLIGAVEVAGLIAGIDLEPLDPALAAVGLGDGRIQHLLGGRPDVNARAITTNEGNDGVVGNDGLTVLEANGRSLRGGGELLEGRHGCGKTLKVSLGFGQPGFCSRRHA